MPISVQGVLHGASVGIGTTVTKGNNTDPCIGVVGNRYFVVDPQVSINDLTLGQYVAGNAGVQTGTRIIGLDRALQVVYLDKPLIDNIQVATDPSVTFSFGKIAITDHGLKRGDILYVGGAGNTTLESNVYTVFDVPNNDEFVTTLL